MDIPYLIGYAAGRCYGAVYWRVVTMRVKLARKWDARWNDLREAQTNGTASTAQLTQQALELIRRR
jgi:hypothetical protein